VRAEPLGTVRRVSGLAEVQEAFRSLPARYLGAHADFDATYHLRLGDVGHTMRFFARVDALGAAPVERLAA